MSYRPHRAARRGALALLLVTRVLEWITNPNPFGEASMTRHEPIPRYGVLTQSAPADEVGRAIESLQLLGFAVLDAGYEQGRIAQLQDRFDLLRAGVLAEYGVG